MFRNKSASTHNFCENFKTANTKGMDFKSSAKLRVVM